MAHSRPGFWETRLVPFLDKYCLALCVLLIVIACARVISTYSALSLTVDEANHLACGMEFVASHKYTIEPQHMPLSRAMQALGPYLAGARPTGLTNRRTEGLAILANSGNFNRMVFLMRLGNLPFFILACVAVCGWGWKMFGKPVAVLATGLFTLLPTMLADAGLGTTDMSLAATMGAAFLAAVLWAEEPTWTRGLIMGGCMALVFLSKATALGYVPLTLGFAFVCYLLTQRPSWDEFRELVRRRAGSFALAAVTTVVLMWAGYQFSFARVHFHGMQVWVPAPEYFRGVRAVVDLNHKGHPGFLLGEYRTTGWWYYLPVALAFKTPIAFLVLVVLGVAACVRERARVTYLFPLAFCCGILLPTMFGRLSVGIRYIDSIYLGLAIIAALGLVQTLKWSRSGIVCTLTGGVLVGWMTVSVAIHHPDYLAYFNGFAGKHPENILVDSNYDWGQDLKFLSKRLHQLGVTQFSLLTLDGVMRHDYLQSWYGLPPFKDIEDAAPNPGWNVVSPTFARAAKYMFPGRTNLPHPWYDQMAPTERVGPLMLYYVTPEVRSQFVHAPDSQELPPQSQSPSTKGDH